MQLYYYPHFSIETEASLAIEKLLMLRTLQQWHTTKHETSSLHLEAHADFIQKSMMVNVNEGGITLPKDPFLPQEVSF